VTLTLTDMSGTPGQRSKVVAELRALAYGVAGSTQAPAPGKPVETVIRYRPGSLAAANTVLSSLSGSVMLAADASVPAGEVGLDIGSDVAVAGAPSGVTAPPTAAPPAAVSPVPSAVTPAQFPPESSDPGPCSA
jgi:hypothetical protein